MTILPEKLLELHKEKQDWIPLRITVDSGATATVIGTDALPSIPWGPSPGSVAGVMYEVANGCRIKNRGQQVLNVRTREGRDRRITCQVCDVNKCLLSTAKLNEAEQRIMYNGDIILRTLRAVTIYL